MYMLVILETLFQIFYKSLGNMTNFENFTYNYWFSLEKHFHYGLTLNIYESVFVKNIFRTFLKTEDKPFGFMCSRNKLWKSSQFWYYLILCNLNFISTYMIRYTFVTQYINRHMNRIGIATTMLNRML